MSFIIKGVDMPIGKDEALLLLILGDGTVAEQISSNRYEEMTDTEAIQIPKGARLIDANALFKDLKEQQIPFNSDINSAINVAPTILESEVMPDE